MLKGFDQWQNTYQGT